jgi:hypothetical protein
MAQLGHCLFCLAVVTTVWAVAGLPVAMRLIGGPYAWLWAPAFGWALANVMALPAFEAVGMSRVAVFGLTAIVLAAALVGMRGQAISILRFPKTLLIGVVLCAILACGVMAGVLPKATSEGMTLASPIFDHSKIALVDEIIRSGVPPGNPFFHEPGTPAHVAYYYLWHFSAASGGILTGVSGWEADAALTAFTALASLLAIAGLAMRWGGGASSAILVAVLATAASLRNVIDWIWPSHASVLADPTGFGGWFFQTSWAPQHVASATSVVIACMLVPRVAMKGGLLAAIVFGLLGAGAYQSSVWVGGLIFPLATAAIALRCSIPLSGPQRLRFAGLLALSAVIAAVLAAPFLYDQIVSASLRGGGAVMAIDPYPVLDPDLPQIVRRLLDPPAFWTLLLPIEFPAVYIGGLIGLWTLAKTSLSGTERLEFQAHCILLVVSFAVSSLLASVIAENNDLGWRAVLPGLLILIAATARLVSHWPAPHTRVVTIIAAAGLLLGLPQSAALIGENLNGLRKPSERVFAATPDLWEAVRRHTPDAERVANSPQFLADMTPWPSNISWALMANRRSCFAGAALALPFVSISAERREAVEAQFERVFDGRPQADDIDQLANRFGCGTIVVTAQDGAWTRDPFASAASYRLVESRPDAWKIYRRQTPPR